MNQDIMIKVEDLSKEYRLGAIGGTTLREDLQRFGAKLRKKEDPTLKIGQKSVSAGERFLALDGVSFEIRKGEAVGIIGHNGAGKSTLLKLITRVTAPSGGYIGLNGRVASMLEVGTGFHPELTGRENIYMNGAILGMNRKEIDSKIEQIIDFSEVRQFIDTPVKRYSSGMYVKLAFSVAAHLDSEIVIMDEVLAVGDMAFQKKCLDKMRDAAKNDGRTVLYVSHNMNTIRQLCDRVIVLDKGKVVFDGGVEEGIEVYMDAQSSSQLFMDYSEWNRPSWLTNQKVKLLSVRYENKSNNLFEAKEPILLSFDWENIENVSNLCLRIEILSMLEVPIGAYTIFDFYSGQKDDTGRVKVELDISELMDATYKMKYVFFYKDKFGNNVNIDFVRGLSFTKSTMNNQDKINWDAKNWGYVHFPQPTYTLGNLKEQ